MHLVEGRQSVWGVALLVVVIIAALFMDGVLPSAAGTGEKMPWSAAASTGLPDEADAAEIKFTAERVQFKSGADLPATAVIRYNITALNSLANFDFAVMAASLEDNGESARVLLELVEYGIDTNDSQVILTLDSNDLVESDEPQLASKDCGGNFDFADNTYIVKATLEKTGSGGTPALHGLRVTTEACT